MGEADGYSDASDDNGPHLDYQNTVSDARGCTEVVVGSRQSLRSGRGGGIVQNKALLQHGTLALVDCTERTAAYLGTRRIIIFLRAFWQHRNTAGIYATGKQPVTEEVV